MSDYVTVKDYRYPLMFIFFAFLILFMCIGMFAFMSIPLFSGMSEVFYIKFIFIPIPLIFLVATVKDLRRIPTIYQLSNQEITLHYLLPFVKMKVIPIDQIDQIFYSRLRGGIIAGYVIVLKKGKKIEVIPMVTGRVLDQFRGQYPFSFFQSIPLDRLQQLIRNSAIG